jgi:hypothetical protein
VDFWKNTQAARQFTSRARKKYDAWVTFAREVMTPAKIKWKPTD